MFSDGDPLRFRGEVYHPYHFSCTGCKEELTATARCLYLLIVCIICKAFFCTCQHQPANAQAYFVSISCDCLHCSYQGGANASRLHCQRAERALLPSLPRQDGDSHLRCMQVTTSSYASRYWRWRSKRFGFSLKILRRPIEERVVTALGKHWHVEHFVCAKVAIHLTKTQIQKDRKTEKVKDKTTNWSIGLSNTLFAARLDIYLEVVCCG